MCSKKEQKEGAKWPPRLDTLAQLGTDFHKGIDNQDFTKLESFEENRAVLMKRARRNYIKNSLSLGLVTVSDNYREKALENANTFEEIIAAKRLDEKERISYWNMYHCSSTLVRKKGKVVGNYCKNRLCLVCNSIRAAVNLNRYKPIFDDWGDSAYFVTLTAPTVKRSKLGERLNEMHKISFDIKEFLKKRHQRKKGDKFEGVRKLECTYRSNTNKFHPHFHFMVKGKKNAELLYKEWLKRTKHLGTSYKGQDCRKANKGAALEVFKYFTKIVSTSSKDKKIYLKGLDAIFKEFRNRRVLQNFGFRLPPEVEQKKIVISLKGKTIDNIDDLQNLLIDEDVNSYLLVHELAILIDGIDGVFDLDILLRFKESSRIAMIEVIEVIELIEDIKNGFEKPKEVFEWIQSEADWINVNTGELLTGFEADDEAKKLTKNFTQYIKKEFD